MSKPAGKPRPRVCVLSPHPLVLPTIRHLLGRARFQVEAVHIGMTPQTDIHDLKVPPAFVYVLNGHGPEWSTEALAAGIRLKNPGAALLVLGEQFTELNGFPLLYLGVRGLVTYADMDRHLVPAVKTVAAGGYWTPRALSAKFVETLLEPRRGPRRTQAKMLSRREAEILGCLLKNMSNKEIANTLHISESTVKFHVSNILAKHGVKRRTDLILRSFQESAA